MNPFSDWQMEVENDISIIAKIGEGIETEARGNCWSFSLTQGQAKELATQDAVYFLEAVISARERQIIEQFGWQHPMLFYCWFDQQAAQLRFSLVSATHNQLPFGSEIHIETDLARIVEQFLSSPYHGGIPFEEFAPASDAQCPIIHPSLPVWATQIPRAETDRFRGIINYDNCADAVFRALAGCSRGAGDGPDAARGCDGAGGGGCAGGAGGGV